MLPGPRVLTSLQPISDETLTVDALRAEVAKRADAGADVIKVFASKSIREGGKRTMSLQQMEAMCTEARSRGLRTVVHAHSPESIQVTAKAGCWQIEHGIFATPDDLRLMAERGVYFDPHVGLVIQNYLQNKSRFIGIGNYTEEGFAHMEKAVATNIAMFRQAVATPGLKIVFGTDAVAGAHGRNVEEIIVRVRDGGQRPMDAIVSMTSLAAAALASRERRRCDSARPRGRHRGDGRRSAERYRRTPARRGRDQGRTNRQEHARPGTSMMLT